MNDEFGYWLAGFFTGEGYLGVRRYMTQYGCCTQLKVRRDDEEILRLIQATTGLGQVYKITAQGTAKPQSLWQVGNKEGCRGIVDIFDRYPLRGRKASEFVIWREAVREWSALQRGNPFDWSRMSRLHETLRDNRQYQEIT